MSKATVIARGGLELRSLPAGGRKIRTLRRGSKLEVLGEETWVRVRASDGSEGYVLADFVERAETDLFPPGPAHDARTGDETRATDAIDAFSPDCDIRHYRNSRFIGNELRADLDFFPCLDRLNDFAKQCDVELFVTSSTRDPGRPVRGAIVPPASRSNHLIGHAVDVNLKSTSGFFNSTALKRDNLPNLPAEIRAFIEFVRNDGEMRWGGDFRNEDPVHIDDHFNGRNATLWDSKFASRF